MNFLYISGQFIQYVGNISLFLEIDPEPPPNSREVRVSIHDFSVYTANFMPFHNKKDI